ncbi:PAS domain-containing protein [Halosimplex pelagicum]|uniref:PAS domain-containing protein n=1 Tax=Halosimplex pelagicum TaxID=869886 RepID=A0A7D5PCH2_9EURY|nr:PAS domain-containing protein [Halosimplex pelagicum]QLH84684.1 PAS domain-containing protein [Halosimplex pelagicum]
MLSAPLVGGPILGAVAVAFGWHAWRLRGVRDRPGGTGLVAIAALLAVVTASASLVIGLGLPAGALAPLTQIAVFGGAVCWATFVIAYTGREDGGRTALVLTLVLPVAGLVGALLRLTPVLSLTESVETVGPVYILLSSVPSATSWGILIGLSLLLVWDATRYSSFERSRGVALSLVGLSVVGLPLVTSALELAGTITIETGAVVTQTVILAALTVGIAVGRPYRSLPIAEAIGRDAIVSNLNDAVVVADGDARIVDMNRSAEALFERPLGEVVREPLSALVDEDLLGPEGLPAESTIPFEGPAGKRYFDVSVSRVRRDGAVEAGYAVALRDVTDERIRGQRLEVLQRVLRHNVRNDMTAVYAMADAAADGGNERVAERLRETADSLVDVSERARAVEESMCLDPASDDAADVSALVTEVAAVLRDQGHDVSVTADDDAEVRRSAELVASICEHLLSYATGNADAPVAVTVERDGSYVDVTVESDGRLLPEQDATAVTNGGETQLEHADDLEIWAVSWGAERLGGELRPDCERGRRVGVRIPVE